MQGEVVDSTGESRYEIRVAGEVAGFAAYRRKDESIAFLHTEVEDRFQGQGLAGELIGFALEEAKQAGLEVLPFCSFVSAYIREHPELSELVPAERRAEFGLSAGDDA